MLWTQGAEHRRRVGEGWRGEADAGAVAGTGGAEEAEAQIETAPAHGLFLWRVDY